MSPGEWHLHHRHWRVYGGGNPVSNFEWLHANCHRQVHSRGVGDEGAAPREGRS